MGREGPFSLWWGLRASYIIVGLLLLPLDFLVRSWFLPFLSSFRKLVSIEEGKGKSKYTTEMKSLIKIYKVGIKNHKDNLRARNARRG